MLSVWSVRMIGDVMGILGERGIRLGSVGLDGCLGKQGVGWGM